ncbi:CBD9-like protein [Polyplosphaeria fusca]|uniref:CBD9-like protein n=1 Tax=Polyplosphaeria fusca TaxID=682080 RepID=A0A9P4R1N2_9PLEO|nr:CBD9-like protein [Polyplosphaeria fusca]
MVLRAMWRYAIALLSIVTFASSQTTRVVDSETGLTFSSYNVPYKTNAGKVITYRIAVPSAATSSAGYDVVLQIAAPNEIGWAGLAWGGSMVTNPLTVAWSSGSSAVVSSRWATGHTTPTIYSGATLTLMTKGTHVNGTHWQFTAKCTGCTSFTSSSGARVLNPKGSNRLAFAYSLSKPSGNSPSASIPIHETPNYWTHDFSMGQNANLGS